MKYTFLTLIILIATNTVLAANAETAVLFAQKQSTEIFVATTEKAVVQTALSILQNDVRQVFDAELILTQKAGGNVKIVAGTIGQNADFQKEIEKNKIDLSAIQGKWEAFQIQYVGNSLFVIGSDARGTAYGLLELSRLIGVSPWEWWADATPEKKQEVSLPANYRNIQSPKVRYRGIFLNDEDWGLLPWANETFEQEAKIKFSFTGKYRSPIGAKTYAKIFELLLRLRANTIWPAMHEVTVPFYFVKGNKEIADKYGIVVGTSHCEPMMRNSASEWDIAGQGDYNYTSNKDNVQHYWAERLQELGNAENIFTIGMRGKHDGLMQGVKAGDTATHKRYLQQIINDQQGLLQQYVNTDIAAIPQVFIPYKEVLEVYDAGLEVPETATLVWCDDNFGYLRRLSNEKEQQRAGGSGVYYHVSYWGKPHDYLWLASTSPALIHTEMKRAYEHGADRLWILNVGDIKPAEYLMEYFLDMAWNGCDAHEGFNHLQMWAAREFGTQNANEATAILKEYYRLANIRKPEHTGWNRVEEGVYPGLTPVKSSEYNPTFNNELQRRIDSYRLLEKRVNQLKQNIAEPKKSAFFQLVEYPVKGASLINQKWLYAQINDSVNSMNAYREIERITADYNSMENGKWNRIMDFHPRNLPVFDAPTFPRNAFCCDSAAPAPAEDGFVLAQNAAQAINIATSGKIIEGLGHSFAAVQLQQNDSLSFVFDIPKTIGNKSAFIRIAAIPNHDVDCGLEEDYHHLAISVNGKKYENMHFDDYGNSGNEILKEFWKQHVLRGQTIADVCCAIRKAGKTRITIKALRPVILDQIMITPREHNDFYEFPIK